LLAPQYPTHARISNHTTYYERVSSYWSGNPPSYQSGIPPSYQSVDRGFINCCLEDNINLDLILWLILFFILILIIVISIRIFSKS
jgi:hypothetical protein